ncbi:MAG TPA: SPOR domain-containing protein [Candidatus Angelobacter sp.]|nr:SPOR domain-containing protein [Candidatus Angelobacter sp.]
MATGTQMSEKEADQIQDTEFTLSTSKLLGIFFALVILCGVFFTMGYLLGKSTSAGGRTEIVATVPSGSSASKPSGANKTPEATQPTNPDASAGKNSDQPTGQSAAKSPDQSKDQSKDQSNSPAGDDAKNGAAGSFMVQVAAVSKQEDAEILVASLQKKQYPVFIANSPGDPLFHVQVGPFSDRKDADAMRTRLAGDGYNAIVK